MTDVSSTAAVALDRLLLARCMRTAKQAHQRGTALRCCRYHALRKAQALMQQKCGIFREVKGTTNTNKQTNERVRKPTGTGLPCCGGPLLHRKVAPGQPGTRGTACRCRAPGFIHSLIPISDMHLVDGIFFSFQLEKGNLSSLQQAPKWCRPT